ncbi:MAG TPA: hypothetical protein VFK02_01210 [Kofleriaceae bacterium]|nr:hypothetical protein [Kofleriaceae bacterium]
MIGRPRSSQLYMRASVEGNAQSLGRLAQLLQRRYRRSTVRSFVMLMADIPRARFRNTDDLETQRLPVLRLV